MQRLTVLPLHPGRAPRWLFGRMVKLGGLISNAVIDEYGSGEFVARLANPYWLQGLSNAIGYDWHSSGSTTVTMGALKEALNYNSDVFIAGGKGKEGIDTPNQIIKGVDYLSIQNMENDFKEKSRIVAKIDSALVFDNIGIYHHTFVMAKNRNWCVVQQAMHNESRSAIRFQVDSKNIDGKDITNETNTSVSLNSAKKTVDLTFSKNGEVKTASVIAIRENMNDIEKMAAGAYVLPKRHKILPVDLTKRDLKVLRSVNEAGPENYKDILAVRGAGRKTLRSLALISSLIYNKEVYERNPTVYAYNLGGKDGIPYRINLRDYDAVVKSLSDIVESINIDNNERYKALRRLNSFIKY